MTDKATHTPLPYECFRDASYYDMWFVRRVNEREWGKGFHLVNGDEAAALRDLLNTRADSHHRLIEALEAARKIIADIDDYMKRPSRGDWGEECACCMGELLDDDRNAIAKIDAAIKEAGR